MHVNRLSTIALTIFILAIATFAFAPADDGNSLEINRSLASESSNKISSPFKYSGYSEAKYTAYTKRSEYVTMDDSTRIAVDIYLPKGADGERFPVVFQYTPYGRAYIIPEKMDIVDRAKYRLATGTSTNVLDRANSHETCYGSSDAIVQTLLSYGYAYVCADARGTGASFGVKIDFRPEFATDGKQIVDWIARQDWSTGKVGMFGGSYLGYMQLVVGAEQPEALKAIFPEVVSFDGFSSEIRPGGTWVKLYSTEDFQTLYEHNKYLPKQYVYPTAPVIDEDGDGELWDEIPIDRDGDGSFLNDYNFPDDPDDVPQYADGNQRQHIYYLASKQHLLNVPYNTLGGIAQFIDTKVTLGADSNQITLTAYNASPVAQLPKLMQSGIAVYNHGSWMDTFITGTTELFCTMQQSNPSKMVIDVGYHETYSPFWKHCGEKEEQSIEAYGIELVRFYDHYLRGIDNGIDREPPIYIYNMNGDGWRFENEWPLARQIDRTMHLCADASLDTVATTDGHDDYRIDMTHNSSWKSKWYSYGVSRWVMANPDDMPLRNEMDDKCLIYTTKALTEDTEVTGFPMLDLFISATCNDADIHVYLEDIDTRGRAVLVTEGVLRAGFHELHDNRLMIGGRTDHNITVLPELPWHGYQIADYDSLALADGNIVNLKFELFPTSWTFLKGHKMRLSIACADTPTFETNPLTVDGSVLTVYREAEHQSTLTLPIIPK